MKDKYFHKSLFSGKGLHNFKTTSQMPRHRWYYLKEGFSAGLVEEAISCNLTRPNQKLQILEPFCGTGTTPLTAALGGHFCTAMEVNPFLAFVSRIKSTTSHWRYKQFYSNLNRVVQSSARGTKSSLEGMSTFTKRDGLDKWLFNRSVLRRFTSLVSAIDIFGGSYKDAMKLSAIVAAYTCCNAQRDGKALRYKSNWRERNYTGKDFMERFRSHISQIAQDISDLPIAHRLKPTILTGDSRQELSALEDDMYDLVVTSPPYLNSFDYSDIYRPELFLGDFVRNNDELRQIRLCTLRSHIQVKWPGEVSFDSTLLFPVLNNLNESENLWDRRIPLMVRAYFDDIFKTFKILKAKIRVNGQVWLVVSTSAYGGVHIPVDFILADAANQAGFSLVGIYHLRQLRTASQQWRRLNSKSMPLRESLIIMSNG